MGLCLLPGGLGRFVPWSIGADHCRLRHVGWEKSGHGDLPRDHGRVLRRFFWMSCCSSFSTFLGLLVRCFLVLFSLGTVLLDLLVGPLLGGCWCFVFAASLVTADLRVAESAGTEDAWREVHCVSGSGPGRKRI